MRNFNRLVFEDDSEKRINESIDKYRKLLIERLIEVKSYPGEDDVFVSERDIDIIERDLLISSSFQKYNRLSSYRKLITKVYLILGITMTLFGLFYNQIEIMIEENPFQLVFVISGLILSLMSVVIGDLYKKRENYKNDIMLVENMSRMKPKNNNKFFNCSEIYEVQYLASKFKEPRNVVIDKIKYLCQTKRIHYSTHKEAEEILIQEGFNKK